MKYLLTNGTIVNTLEEAIRTPFGYKAITDKDYQEILNLIEFKENLKKVLTK